MALTDSAVRQARPARKDYTLNDTLGLSLFVPVSGAKRWYFLFSWAGKQSRISLGAYPDISLKDARALRDGLRELVAKGVDPRVHRRQERRATLAAAEHTFNAVYLRWRDFKALSLEERRQSTLSPIKRIFPKDVLPALGERSVFDITRVDWWRCCVRSNAAAR